AERRAAAPRVERGAVQGSDRGGLPGSQDARHSRERRGRQGRRALPVSRDGFNFAPGDLPDLARLGNVLPLCREMDADLLTPVAAWMRLARGARSGFLRESIEGGETLARYSFLGRDPVGWIRVEAGSAAASSGPGPIAALRKTLAPFRPVRLPDLPRF